MLPAALPAVATTTPPALVRRADYKPPEFLVERVNLTVNIGAPLVTVHNVMQVRRNPAARGKGLLVLDGEFQELQRVIVDGRVLNPRDYDLTSHHLTLRKLPEQATVEIISTHNPHENTALSGLYAAGGQLLNTQMEAEGFRRFSYYPDRPDVLAIFTCRIEADAKQYPILLANGNLVASGKVGKDRHFAEWHDPHPKPCYLFALVAGQLAMVKDTYTTQAGKAVSLEFYVERGTEKQVPIAMQALKDAMRWDEETYGFAYDLDRFMVVATPHFNMGAMENKGLNIFNSDCVLADPQTATDADIAFVERVVAHEYFHNWTGNRITCRDWFQLSLKEGLTVFREQQFMAAQHDRALERVQEVRSLRARQFAEDAGPTAHPVRPDQYQAIDNFYTATVYDKGAEVCRMLHTLLHEHGWRAGMRLYVQRHDGQAATCDEFVAAMADANHKDFSQFMRWYAQAGTPTLHVVSKYDPRKKVVQLIVKQSCPPTPGQPKKQPFHLPLAVGLLDSRGRELMATKVLELTKPSQTFVFHNIATKPVVSLLRGFSAPVRLDYARPLDELYLLLATDPDLFCRYDAAQQLYFGHLLNNLGKKTAAPAPLLEALQKIAGDPALPPALAATLLAVPSVNELGLELAARGQLLDPEALFEAREQLRAAIAASLAPTLLDRYQALQPRVNATDGRSMGERALKNLCLAYLLKDNPKKYQSLAVAQAKSKNLTEQLGALSALANVGGKVADAALADFAKKWGGAALTKATTKTSAKAKTPAKGGKTTQAKPAKAAPTLQLSSVAQSVLHKWLSLQAGIAKPTTVAAVKKLLAHPLYERGNPNAVRSLLGVFANSNQVAFHAKDGSGYALLASEIKLLDARNPQLAARLVLAFERWRNYEPKRQKLMQATLEQLASAQLSPNTAEQIGKMLAAPITASN